MESTNNHKKTDVFDVEAYPITCGTPENLHLYDNINTETVFDDDTYEKFKLKVAVYILVYEGDVDITINGNAIRLTKNTLFTCMPECVIEVLHKSEDFRYLMIVIFPRLFNLILKDLEIQHQITDFKYDLCHCTPEQVLEIVDIYNTIKEDYSRVPYEFQGTFIRCFLDILITKQLEFCQEEIIISQPPGSRQYDVYKKFITELNQHATEHRAVGYYAEVLGITPKYLSFVTLHYSNKNASQWIDECVAERAKSMMIVDGFSTEQVALELNFENITSFVRYFKRITKMSPREFVKTANRKQSVETEKTAKTVNKK